MRKRVADLPVVAEAALYLTVVALVLRVGRFAWVTRLFRLQSGPAAPGSVAAATRVGWAVGAAANRLPWQPTCLVKAVAGAAMLRRRGSDAELTLGVARLGQDAAYSAHAWLSCGDWIFIGAGERPHFDSVASFHAGVRA